MLQTWVVSFLGWTKAEILPSVCNLTACGFTKLELAKLVRVTPSLPNVRSRLPAEAQANFTSTRSQPDSNKIGCAIRENLLFTDSAFSDSCYHVIHLVGSARDRPRQFSMGG
jgi:hypothetical protein